jgi:hypothetical protein
MLQVAVTLLAETPEGIKVKEDTQTLVVNAHGGLLKLKAELLPGQPVMLANLRSGNQEKAHVVRIDQPSPDFFAVAFEFDRPAPNFWPIVFPPEDWGAKPS